MFDSNDDAQERSDAQTLDCPECGQRIHSITRSGPATATAGPCGCDLGSLRVADLREVTA